MKGEEILSRKEFQKCADFHGHICPGLSTGYLAAKIGLDWLHENRAEDEEVVAIVENNACGVDAIQVLTGCTFGKGNLIHKDHGKPVYTFLERRSGRGVRVAVKHGAFSMSERHRELVKKVRDETATEEEREEFQKVHLQKSQDILGMPVESLFTIEEVDVPLPPKAKVEPSVLCEHCGESTMASKMVRVEGKMICGDCMTKIRG